MCEDSDAGKRRRVLWIETGVVLLLVMAIPLARIVCWRVWGNEYRGFEQQMRHLEYGSWIWMAVFSVDHIFSALARAIIVLFIVWRSGDPWSQFGLVSPKPAKDILIGLGLALIVSVIHETSWVLQGASHHWAWSRLFPAGVGTDPRALLLLTQACAVGFSEELVFRGYLISRFETLIGSTWKSIMLSAIVFGVVHLYQGTWAAVTIGLAGILWGIAFCATRRIWPMAIGHAAWDFIVFTHALAALTR